MARPSTETGALSMTETSPTRGLSRTSPSRSSARDVGDPDVERDRRAGRATSISRSRLETNTSPATTPATPTIAPVIAERTGTARAPRPGSSANRRPSTVGRRSAEAAHPVHDRALPRRRLGPATPLDRPGEDRGGEARRRTPRRGPTPSDRDVERRRPGAARTGRRPRSARCARRRRRRSRRGRWRAPRGGGRPAGARPSAAPASARGPARPRGRERWRCGAGPAPG